MSYEPLPADRAASPSAAARDESLAVPAAASTASFGVAEEVVALLDRYVDALQAGRQPDRAALLAAHPELRSQLEACLAGIDFVHRAGQRGAAEGDAPLQLGDFRLLREVGRGGMGVVYEAEQLSLRRRVAVKVLRFGLSGDPEAMQRFRQEAETIASLHHTNIVPIIAVGCDQGVHYYAMQFVAGESLADVSERGRREGTPLSAAQVAAWGLQAAEALAHAHQRGVIHRDVKPSNLILDGDGRLWLTDFGLAKRSDEAALTMTGALLGTPRYMSPEQASSAVNPVDARSDVYSLGATLYELLAGQPLFDGRTPQEIIRQILTEEPRPLQRWRPDLPRDLDTIVAKCLFKEPGYRYATASELAVDLRALAEGRPIAARRAGLLERGWRWAKRQHRSVRLAAASASLAAGAVVVGLALHAALEERRAGHLRLQTPGQPLDAAVVDRDTGELAAHASIPLPDLMLPAGDYELVVAAPGRPSKTTSVEVRRGAWDTYELAADENLLWERAVERGWAFVQFGARTDLIALGTDSIQRVAGLDGQAMWSVDAAAFAERGGPSVRFAWPWDPLDAASELGLAQSLYSPWVMERAHDLDEDGEPDVVLAGNHQAWLAALSGRDGRPLWVVNRETPTGASAALPPYVTRMSGIVESPVWVGDLDQDGATDLACCVVDQAHAEPQRWIEAVSGRTGESLWRTELPAAWFDAGANAAAAPHARWRRGALSVRRDGGSSGPNFDVALRATRASVEVDGPWVHVPTGLQRVQQGDGAGGLLLAAVVGRRLVLLDESTGELRSDAPTLPAEPALPLRWARLATAVAGAAVAIADDGPVRAGAGPGDVHNLRVVAAALESGGLRWERAIRAYLPRPAGDRLPAPEWPLLADLDGDGCEEVVLPTDSSAAHDISGQAWGELSVWDGTAGATRWTRRVPCVDQQVDRVVVGPDLNGDDVRELYVATLWASSRTPEAPRSAPGAEALWTGATVDSGGRSARVRLFVEALDGARGVALWRGDVPLPRRFRPGEPAHARPQQFQLGNLQWGAAGVDGWPQLIVNVGEQPRDLPGANDLSVILSSHTGRCVAVVEAAGLPQRVDLDGDGLADWCWAARDAERAFAGAAKLTACREASEPWRRLGGRFAPLGDFDGDGIAELVQSHDDKSQTLFSGASGRRLWTLHADQWPDNAAHWCDLRLQTPLVGPDARQRAAASLDLDGDGRGDAFAAVANAFALEGAGFRLKLSPLHAVAGRDGRILWSADFQCARIDHVFPLRAGDLDADGAAEIYLLAWCQPWADQIAWQSAEPLTLWLIAVDGRTGRTRWKQALAPPLSDAGQNYVRMLVAAQRTLELAWCDCDQDGVQDPIVAGFADGDCRRSELRVYSGADGRLLGRRELNPSVVGDQLASPPAPRVVPAADAAERPLIVLGQCSAADVGVGGQRALAIAAFVADTSLSPAWTWNAAADASAGGVSSDEPSPVLGAVALGADGPGVAVVQGSPPRLHVLNSAGQLVSSAPLRRDSVGRNVPGVHLGDLDGDGVDEAVYWYNGPDADELRAAPVTRLDAPLWNRVARSPRIGQLFADPLAFAAAQSLVIESHEGWHGLEGLDPATGRRLWSIAAPGAPPASGSAIATGAFAWLGRRADGPAFAWFSTGPLNVVRQSAPSAAHPPATTAASTRLPVDPRLRRRLPWAPAVGAFAEWPALVRHFACGTAWVVVLLVALQRLARAVRQRRFSLRDAALLTACGAAGCALLLVRTSPLMLTGVAAADYRLRVMAAATSLLLALPLLALLAVVALKLVRRSWRGLAAWAGTVACASLLAAWYAAALDLRRRPMLPDETWDWGGWHWILPIGAYAAGWVAAIAIVAAAALRFRTRRTAGRTTWEGAR